MLLYTYEKRRQRTGAHRKKERCKSMGRDGKPVTEAQKRATAKYERENYDKILLRLRKGTKDRILQKIGEDGSVNGYIAELIYNDLGE